MLFIDESAISAKGTAHETGISATFLLMDKSMIYKDYQDHRI